MKLFKTTDMYTIATLQECLVLSYRVLALLVVL